MNSRRAREPRPRLGGDRDIVIRCADCARSTGKPARIGLVFWHENGWLDAYDPRVHPALNDGPSIELTDAGAESGVIRFFCRRCEQRTGRRSYKVVPKQFFLDRLADDTERTKTFTI